MTQSPTHNIYHPTSVCSAVQQACQPRTASDPAGVDCDNSLPLALLQLGEAIAIGPLHLGGTRLSLLALLPLRFPVRFRFAIAGADPVSIVLSAKV